MVILLCGIYVLSPKVTERWQKLQQSERRATNTTPMTTEGADLEGEEDMKGE